MTILLEGSVKEKLFHTPLFMAVSQAGLRYAMGGRLIKMNREELRSKKDRGPYDQSLEDNLSMYDNMPYVRDVNLCNHDTQGLISGNVIKYYSYKMDEVVLV